MRRIYQRDLMRGHLAQRAAILLILGLLMVLVVAILQGVTHLSS